MSRDLLRAFLVDTAQAREKVNLRQFAKKHLQKKEKQPELLCDFFSVLIWVCSASDCSLLETGKISLYSWLYGNHSKYYEERMVGFVSTIRSFGLEPVFFVECCPLTDFDSPVETELYRLCWSRVCGNCSSILQVCSGQCELSRVKWSLKEGMVHDTMSVLGSKLGVRMIYCSGKVAADAIPYMKANKHACGILTWDTSYAIVPHCGLFLLDLFPPRLFRPGFVLKPDDDVVCEVVWSSWLASTLELEESQLIDLAILSGNMFTSVLNSQLHPCDVLEIVKPDVKSIAAWVSKQTTAILSNSSLQEFLSQNPFYEEAIKLSYQFYSRDNPGLDSCPAFESYRQRVGSSGSLVPMLSVLRHQVFVRPVLIEPNSIKQPQFCDATRDIRKLIYALSGLSKVAEVAFIPSSTVMNNPTRVLVEFPWIEDNHFSFMEQSNSTPQLSHNVRLAMLFNGISCPPVLDIECEQYTMFRECCIRQGKSLGEVKISSVATILLSCLHFFKSCNSKLQPSPDVYICELEALLATSLFLLVGISPWDFPILPSSKAVTIGSRFSHLLDQAYWLASCLGLSPSLPSQGDIFSCYAYIPVYHIMYFYEQNQGTTTFGHGASLDQLLALYAELWEMDSVLELRAEMLIKDSKPTLLEATQLFRAAVNTLESCEFVKKVKDLQIKEGAREGSGNDPSTDTHKIGLGALLAVEDGAGMNSMSSTSSLERNELSYSLECHAMEEDHYYSSQPMLEASVDGKEEFDNLDGNMAAREQNKITDQVGEMGGDDDEMLLKVTVESISSMTKASDPPVFIDSKGTKKVAMDSVLVNTANSSKKGKKHKYRKGHLPNVTTKLPILEHRKKILELIRDHTVACIEGETGCGKSTMVPQFILDEALNQLEPQYCNVIVTQPRRVAAVKLAERVAAERREPVGRTIGYCVGGDINRAPQTKVTYCTVGYFLQVLVHNPSAIQWYTHIILDEVHERSMDTDFAMLVVRRLLSTRQRTKIILMSATLQGDMLTKYFEESFHFSQVSSPYFVGARRYPVKQNFYEDLGDLADSCSSSAKKSHHFLKDVGKKLPSTAWQDCMVVYPCVTEINMDICTHLIISQSNLGESVLVFLPGIASISLYCDRLTQHLNDNNLEQKFKIFILHSQVPFEEQKDAFENPASDVVNVILATNIAESSITLPKLRMVINFGIYHQLKYDPKRRTSCLKRRWCSRASCAQRAGRAGRVCDGIVIHLFSKKFHDHVLSTFDPPEILTAPLAKLILQVKMICKQLGESSPSRFLSDAIEFPPMEQVHVALRDLAELGAIASSNTSTDIAVDEEANITFLGYFCLALPVELSLCRLVLNSILFGIPFEGIVVAASLSLYQDIFSRPSRELLNPEVFLQRLKASTTSRVTFDGGHFSHAVQICTLFRKWIEFRNANLCTVSGCSRFSMIRAFCMNVGVRWERLFQLESAVASIAGKIMTYIPEGHAVHTELLNLTKLTDHRRDFFVRRQKKKTAQYSEIYLNYCEDILLIKALMVCSFSNQLLIGKRASDCSSPKRVKKAQSAIKTMTQCGMNPAQTLVMHDLQNPTIPSLQFLTLSILPERHCNVMVQNDTGFISLVPKLGSMVQTTSAIVVDIDTQNSPWNPFMMEDSVVQQKLSPDIIHLWQYGENKRNWKISGLQDAFTRPSHPYHVIWERLSPGCERAYNTNWRQPVESLVDLGQDDVTFFAVAATLQGTSLERVVSVHDMTVLPNHGSESCSSLLLILAFQPPTASISFLFNKEYHICGMKIEKRYIYFHSSQVLTLDDIVRINELRKAMSDMLASNNVDDGEIVFEMGKVSRIHSLLDLMLRRTPANLVSELTSPAPFNMLWEVVGFGLDEDVMSVSGDDSDVLDSQDLQDCDDFYPPMKLAILSKAVVKDISSHSFRTNYLFRSHDEPNMCQNSGKQNTYFQLSPLAKSFVPQSHLFDYVIDPVESMNCEIVDTALAPPRKRSKILLCEDVKSGSIDSVSDLQTGPQPKEMQLKIFQPHSATSNGTRGSCQNSCDISHVTSFFPQGFPGFGDFTASYRGHFNPCVVLQASPSSRIVNQRTHSSVIEFEVPTISVWSGVESLAQLRRNFNQCVLLFGEMLMSKLRLRHIDCRSPIALTQGQKITESKDLQAYGINEIAQDFDSERANSSLCKNVDSIVSDGGPTEKFMLGRTSPPEHSQFQNLNTEDSHGMPRIFRPNSRRCGQHKSVTREVQQADVSGRLKRPQPCLRYNPPVYIPPPAFSVIQSQAQKRIPPAVQNPGKGKQKLYGKSKNPPAQFMPTAYHSRYQHPVWLSNMLCAPPKVNPSDVYKTTEVSNEEVKNVSCSERHLKMMCAPNFIPPAGSILNSEHAGTFVVHKNVSKKDREKSSHQICGISDNILACFYHDYLTVVGKTPVATLCGPIYRQWLLNTCSVSINVLSRLPFTFFEKYPKKFLLFVEKGKSMVEVAQGDSSNFSHLPSCTKDSPSDDDGVGRACLHNDRQVLGNMDLNCISNSNVSLAVTSQFEDGDGSVISRPLDVEHHYKQLNVSDDHTNVTVLPSSEVNLPTSVVSYSDHSKVLDLIIPPPPGFGPMSQSVSSKAHYHVDDRIKTMISDECAALVPQSYDQNENSIPYHPLSQAPGQSLSDEMLFGTSTSLADSLSAPDIIQSKQEHCDMQEVTRLNDKSPLLSDSVSTDKLGFTSEVHSGNAVVESELLNVTHPVKELESPYSLPDFSSGSVLSNLHQALLNYGIDDAEKLDAIMKTVEQMKVSSDSVVDALEVVDQSLLSSDSSENELVHETEIGHCHFPSALITPGNSEPFLLSSINVQTGETHDIDTFKEPRARLETFAESKASSVENVQNKTNDSSLVVHSTLPLVNQESGTSFQDPTASYLLSIIANKSDLMLPVAAIDSPLGLNTYGAIYCSSLEKSLPDDNILKSDCNSSSLNISMSEGHEEIGDGLCSKDAEEKTKDEDVCCIQSENLEPNDIDLDCQREDMDSLTILEKKMSSSSQKDEKFCDAPAIPRSRKLEESEIWSAIEEDSQHSVSVPDATTDSHSWPDLIEGESFPKSAESDQNSLGGDIDMDFSAPSLLQCDKNYEGKYDGHHCSSASESVKSADSWPGVEQDVPIVKVTSYEVHPTVSSSDAATNLEEAWSVSHTNSEEEKSAAPECNSPSVSLSVDISSDWMEVPKEQDEQKAYDASFSKRYHSKSSSSSSLPDQEWYVPPQRKTTQYTEQQSAALLECMKRFLRDRPLSFYAIVLHYRKEFPEYPFLTKDYFFSNTQHYTCTVNSRNILTVSLCGGSKTASALDECDKQQASGDTPTYLPIQSTSPSSAVEVTSSAEQDRQIVLKEVCKVINQNKKNSIRCSQVRRRISFGLRPNERLDRRFFERHSSLFEIEEIRYKREGDENDFFVSLVKQRIGSVHPYSGRSRSKKSKEIKTRSRSQSCRGANTDDCEVTTSHGKESSSACKSSENKAKGKEGSSGEDRNKRKKRKHKIENFRERMVPKGDRRRGLRGRGGHRGEPLYVYGSGLPFYCSKAESEGEV